MNEINNKRHEYIDNVPIVFCMTHKKAIRIIKEYNKKVVDANIVYILADKKIKKQVIDQVKSLKESKEIIELISINNSLDQIENHSNIYTALLRIMNIKRDLIVISLTESYNEGIEKYDFDGLELGYYLDAVENLKGYSIVALDTIVKDDKIKIKDQMITILKDISCTRTTIPIKFLSKQIKANILEKIFEIQLHKKHNIISIENFSMLEIDKYDYDESVICDGIIEYILNYNPGR